MKLMITSILFMAGTMIHSTSAQCFSLQGTQECQGFEDAFIAPTAVYSDLNSFDNFIRSRHDSAPNYISQFQSAFSCPSYNGIGQRHHQAIFCALVIESKASVCNKASKPLCQDTCIAALNGLRNVFNNRSICSDAAGINADSASFRKSTLDSYSSYCQKYTIKNRNSGICNDGLLVETSNTCGFTTSIQAIEFCKNNQNDACCPQNNTNQNTNMVLDAPPKIASFNPVLAGNLPRETSEMKLLGDGNDLNSEGTTLIIVGVVLGSIIIAFSFTAWLLFRWRINKAKDFNDTESIGESIDTLYNKPAPKSQSSEHIIITPPPPVFQEKRLPIIKEVDEPEFISKPLHIAIPQKHKVVTVIRSYFPNLSDEVAIRVGDQINIIEAYDDGWAYAENLTTKVKGTVPMMCLDVQLIEDDNDDGKAKKIRLRISSLYNKDSFKTTI